MWYKLLIQSGHDFIIIVISRNRPVVSLILISVLVSPGSDIGAKAHIGGSIPHLLLVLIIKYSDLAYTFHDGFGPLICHNKTFYVNENILPISTPYSQILLRYRCDCWWPSKIFGAQPGIILGLGCPLNGRIDCIMHPEVGIFPTWL